MINLVVGFVLGLASAALAVDAGLGFKVDEKVFAQNKKAVISQIDKVFKEIHFDDINILDNVIISNFRFQDVNLEEQSAHITLEGNRGTLKLDRISGSLQGHFHRKKLFGTEDYDFGLGIDDGGLSLELVATLKTQQFNGREIPALKVVSSKIGIDSNRVRIINTSDDFGMKIIMGLLNGAKGLIVGAVQDTINMTFMSIANKLLEDFNLHSQGKIGGDILNSILYMLPGNNIHIPDQIGISFAMPPGHEIYIAQGRMEGYFTGEILGSYDRSTKSNGQRQDLKLSDRSPPLQVMMSTNFINHIFSLILNKNQIHIDLPYSSFSSNDAPIDWTSTQLEGAIPHFTDYVGFDVPLNTRIKNHKAPTFHLFTERAQVSFSVEVELYDTSFRDQYASILLENVLIDFNATMSGHELTILWNAISLGHASVTSKFISAAAKTKADRHVEDYFNWLFKFLIPWVNSFKPENLSRIPIPTHFPGLMDLKTIELVSNDGFGTLYLDPVFVSADQPARRVVVREPEPLGWEEFLENITPAELADKAYFAWQLAAAYIQGII